MGRQLGSPGLPGLGAPVVHSPSAFSFSRLLPGEHHFETTWSKRGRFLRRSRSARHRAAPNCFRSSLDRWGLAVGGRSRGPPLLKVSLRCADQGPMAVLASGHTPGNSSPRCPDVLNPATPSQLRRGSPHEGHATWPTPPERSSACNVDLLLRCLAGFRRKRFDG